MQDPCGVYDLFISSTFRDMQREREILTRVVLPRLRERSPPATGIFERDLRWGLTRSMVEDGAVVGACLEQVRACAPYVFGMIGSRTGEQLPHAHLARFDPAFASYEPADCSLTEWELRYAAHCRGADEPPTPVMLRTPAFSASLGMPEAASETSALESLRGLIAESPDFAAFHYGDFEAFERLAAQALEELLAHRRTSPPALRRNEGPLIDRHADLRRLARLSRRGRPALVFGPPGAGTTWLVQAWRDAQPGLTLHADGRTASIADVALRLRERAGLAGAQATAFGDPVGDEAALGSILATIGRLKRAGRPVTIVFDHYEEAFGAAGAAELAWVPKRLGCDVRLLVVTHQERLRDQAQHHGWRTLNIGPPVADAVVRFATAYLAQFSKYLGEDEAKTLAGAAWSGDLHVALAALEELRRHGAHETLGARARLLAAARSSGELVDTILDGASQPLPEHWRDAPRDVLLALSLSVRGLSREEMELVLRRSTPDALDRPMPSHVFGALWLLLAPLLVRHDDLFDLHQSALDDWLARPGQDRRLARVGGALAASLSDFAPERAAVERPNLAYRIGGPARLAELLSDPHAALAVIATGPTFFEGWLALLRPSAQADVFESWLTGIGLDPLGTPDRVMLAELAARAGDAARAEALLGDTTAEQAADVATARLQIALIRRDPEAFEREMAARRGPGRGDLPRTAMVLLAGAASGVFDPGSAAAGLLAAAGREAAEDGSPLALAQFHVLAGQLAIAQARWRAALRSFHAGETLARRLGATPLLCRALERRGAVLIEQRRFSRARRAATECRDLAERTGLARYEALAFERLLEIACRRADWPDAYRLGARYVDRMGEAGGDVARAGRAIDFLEQLVRGDRAVL